MNWQNVFYRIDTRNYPENRVKTYSTKLYKQFGQLWGTKDGRIIPIRFMRDNHLLNALQAKVRQLLSLVDANDEITFESLENGYWYLLEECRIRGKNIPTHDKIAAMSDRLDKRMAFDIYPTPHDIEDMPF